jgi:hypothetical protein
MTWIGIQSMLLRSGSTQSCLKEGVYYLHHLLKKQIRSPKGDDTRHVINRDRVTDTRHKINLGRGEHVDVGKSDPAGCRWPVLVVQKVSRFQHRFGISSYAFNHPTGARRGA